MKPDADPVVIVSVLYKSRSPIEELLGRGFHRLEKLPELTASVEITGGYFSYMRGDRASKSSSPSVFQPFPVLELDPSAIIQKGSTVVAFGPWQDQKFKGEGVVEMEGAIMIMPEWRTVLRVIGPAGDVRTTIEEDIFSLRLRTGVRADLEAALKWWTCPDEVREVTDIFIWQR